ncbi:MAG TPA: proton-conducting transporter membrane subunit [Chitinispirillaceae bacterium]|nr:proton-conducting transporter membrane subunit [Chitinispirillaceae bacterium]
MSLPLFLVSFPLLTALILSLVNNNRARSAAVISSFVVLAIASIALSFKYVTIEMQFLSVPWHMADHVILVAEILLSAFIIYTSIRNRQILVTLLVLAQFLPLLWFEFKGPHVEISNPLLVDRLSVVMALIIGIVGGIISIYSLGYMHDFHENHKEFKDRRRFFFFIVFAFISAMFGIVFSNNLRWLYFFWEVTTVSSYLLIGYNGTEESKRNAFLALRLNVLGGLGFAGAIIYLQTRVGILELDKVMFSSKSLVLLPVALMSFAGLAKSAQLPFSKWLLGAMVAPSPVSALLHSSTMVKAGVYLIVRFANVLQGTTAGFMIALIGGVTFLACSCIAVSQSDAKRVLAYSTIANLGLIVLCAGLGTYEAVWAAILLIIFHAVAKCLLFLCVGVVEHKIHSRNIEDMAGLIITMPKLSIMMQIGMAGMFLAPFGMLISKWAVLQALVDYNPILAVFVVFGSSVTLLYWVKWMGRLLTVVGKQDELEHTIHLSEWFSLGSLSLFTVATCGLFPVVANFLIEPYIGEIYHTTVNMGQGNILTMLIMLAMIALFPLSFFNYGKRVKVVDAYLSGANTPQSTEFYNSLNASQQIQMRSYYMQELFDEKKLFGIGMIVNSILILISVVASLC